MLIVRTTAADIVRLLSGYRQIAFSITGTALVVCAGYELFRPIEPTWIALPPEARAGSDRHAVPSSSAGESMAARRFRSAFDDPAQPLFSRIAAISPAMTSLPLPDEPDNGREAIVAQEGAQEEPERGVPKEMAQASSPDANPSISFAGIWAPSASACSPKSNNRQLLPAVINEEGAWAGEVSCRFRRLRQEGNTAIVASTCSNGRQRWTANVRLAVAGDRLVWSSERGSQAYVRCPPRIVEARAGI